MLGTGGDFGYVNWEASRWGLAALLTPRSYALNFGGFGATIRIHMFLGVAQCCRIGLSKPISLLAVPHCFCVLRSQWCQQWCQNGIGHSLSRQV
jgi:hypothetical protein